MHQQIKLQSVSLYTFINCITILEEYDLFM